VFNVSQVIATPRHCLVIASLNLCFAAGLLAYYYVQCKLVIPPRKEAINYFLIKSPRLIAAP